MPDELSGNKIFKKKHETIKLICLKETVILNTMEMERNEKTTEAIQNAEKNFALDLPLLVEETARDDKILRAIATIEADQTHFMFYP